MRRVRRCHPLFGRRGEYGLGKPSGAGQQNLALARRGAHQHRLQQPSNDAEAEVAFKLTASGREDRHTRRVCEYPSLLQQPCFPHTRRAVDNQHLTVAGARLLYMRRKLIAFTLAL